MSSGIISHPSTKAFRSNFDRVFRGGIQLCDECGEEPRYDNGKLQCLCDDVDLLEACADEEEE